MAKEAGMAWTTCSVDGADGTPDVIKNDVTSLTVSLARDLADVTGLDKSAHERLLLLATVSVGLSGVFNDATGQSHDTFQTVPTTSVARTVTLTISGQTFNTPAAPEMLPTDYALSRAADGSFTWTVPLALSNGVAVGWL